MDYGDKHNYEHFPPFKKLKKEDGSPLQKDSSTTAHIAVGAAEVPNTGQNYYICEKNKRQKKN
jgi:hypothetical protein